MEQDSEETVLSFLKLIGFPGVRRGETDEGVCNYLKSNNYNLTPDLVAGPPEIKEAPIEGLFFIDVIQPTSDLLFKSEFYKEHEMVQTAGLQHAGQSRPAGMGKAWT